MLEATPSEHIYIGSDDAPKVATAARTIAETLSLKNPLRSTRTELTLFAEGYVRVRRFRAERRVDAFDLDLHYLDPVPSITRVVTARMLYSALGLGAFGVVAGLLAGFDTLRPLAIPATLAACTAALVALGLTLYRSHERIDFSTIHGRAPVLSLVANLGSIRRFRAAVPVLSRAIEEAAERIGDDTSAYLRAEMREHYRLRGEGVLSNQSCADSTGRILAQFDVQL